MKTEGRGDGDGDGDGDAVTEMETESATTLFEITTSTIQRTLQ